MKVTAREMPIFWRLASQLADRVVPRGAIAQVGPAVLIISLIAGVAATTAGSRSAFQLADLPNGLRRRDAGTAINCVGPGIPLARKTRGEPPAATPSDP